MFTHPLPRTLTIGLLSLLLCSSLLTYSAWAQAPAKVDTSEVKLPMLSDTAKRQLLHRTQAGDIASINSSVVITPAYKSTKGVFCKPLPVGMRSLEEFYRIRIHLTQRCEHVNYQSP